MGRIEAGERIDLIDSLRALALFGVIVMNIGGMVMRFVGDTVFAAATPVDMSVALFDLVFIQGKACAAFAFLFGLGFAILMIRAEAKGTAFAGFYTRRMLALVGFGLINQFFLYWGDILVLYALLGLVLLPLRGWSERRLLTVGLVLVLVPPIVIGLAGAINGGPLPSFVPFDDAREAARGLAAVTSPNYSDYVGWAWFQSIDRRLTDTAHMIIYDLGVLGLFMLGAWTARRGLLFDVPAHRATLRRIAMVCLPVGLLLSLVYAARFAGAIGDERLNAFAEAAYIGLPVLAFGYIATLALLFARRAAGLQRLLAPTGRMALTNYLASGAIGCFTFYGYGLGLLREFNFGAQALFAIAIFAGLTAFSHLWLARFRYGPAEWLWRCLSHGTLQPLAISAPTPKPV